VRKVTREHGGASVIPLARAIRRLPKLEVGVTPEGDGMYVHLDEGASKLTFRMSADQAEDFVTDVMQFVHELRNGGKLT
jgi:hypothetical protein